MLQCSHVHCLLRRGTVHVGSSHTPCIQGCQPRRAFCIKHSVTVDPAPVLGCASSGLVLAYTFVVDWRPAGCLSSYHGDAVPLENVCNVKLSACLCEDNFGLCLVQCLLLACL